MFNVRLELISLNIWPEYAYPKGLWRILTPATERTCYFYHTGPNELAIRHKLVPQCNATPCSSCTFNERVVPDTAKRVFVIMEY